MSSATPSSKTSPPATTTRGIKPKPSKIVILKISSPKLSDFPHEKTTRKPSQSKLPTSSTSTATLLNASADHKNNTKAISTSGGSEKPSLSTDDSKRKGTPSNKAGVKRGAGVLADGTIKPRAKPGPKKRMKMENGTADNDSVARPWTTPAPLTGHKLGPKANQGAINAGLRALDRTGKPCRKWAKQGFRIKSFTGATWQIPSWHAPKKIVVNVGEDAGQNGTPISNSENQINNSSSNVGSDNSHNGILDIAHAESSPIPGVALST